MFVMTHTSHDYSWSVTQIGILLLACYVIATSLFFGIGHRVLLPQPAYLRGPYTISIVTCTPPQDTARRCFERLDIEHGPGAAH